MLSTQPVQFLIGSTSGPNALPAVLKQYHPDPDIYYESITKRGPAYGFLKRQRI